MHIVIVPSVAKGNGSGHIVRCFRLARALGPAAAVYLPAAKTSDSWSAAELTLAYSRELEGIRIIDEPSQAFGADLVVLDRRASSLEELRFWESLAPVLALDEGGAARSAATYLIDILPRAKRSFDQQLPAANRISAGFLDLPLKRRPKPAAFRRILLSFGGEDPAGLSIPLARDLLATGLVQASDLTIVSGALNGGMPHQGLEGVTVIGAVQDLKEHLHTWDLVLTQFGLTAYEAAWAGCGVLLLNPSAYHQRLSRVAGFPELGVRRARRGALARFLQNPVPVLARVAAILPREPESLAAFIGSLEVSGPVNCPACGCRERLALWRSPSRSYFRCPSCGMLYLTRFGSKRSAPYTKDYFFEEYRRQYGRSYLDDWSSLVAMAEGRLERIEALAGAATGPAGQTLGRTKGLSLLDVGCAYGPFMEAARGHGHEAYGIDISVDAARYVRDKLGLPATVGDFSDSTVVESLSGPFDALSMWYVIEHFDNVDAVLRNASALLRSGGILALSTPSGEGVSARLSRNSFFQSSPEDHFTIWEPSRVRNILAAHGFKLERIRMTGHHPERFPLARRLGAGSGARSPGLPLSLVLALLGLVSRLFGLGDTFEIYARKTAPDTEQGRAVPSTESTVRAIMGSTDPSPLAGSRLP
jgi:2-polyprenyl-3-methyl-5-hydroxy-6-metoxy-1,4-benzoquinol methylase/spore coat polysaccharide biosynthesis predicted glycosyltransferase SpsG